MVVRLIVSNVVLFLLIGQHFVEQLLDFLTVFAFVSIAISIPVVTLQVPFQSSIEFLASISHQNVIAALIALISLTKFVDFLESFGLLVLLGVQARVHVQIRNLLFGVYGHILVLLDRHFFVNVEH